MQLHLSLIIVSYLLLFINKISFCIMISKDVSLIQKINSSNVINLVSKFPMKKLWRFLQLLATYKNNAISLAGIFIRLIDFRVLLKNESKMEISYEIWNMSLHRF